MDQAAGSMTACASNAHRPAACSSARPESGSWRSFDIQLAFYALALAVIGLLMALTNSTDGGPLAAGSMFTRGLMWFALAILAFTLSAAFDYRWLRTFSWPIYLVNIGLLLLTLAIGDRDQRRTALGLDRRV